ncbi:MAG: hypothetical protein Q7K13_09555 [Polynucleobacter sp.]|nr:hypothetical protein [Polynucleobacter sp.]
MKPKQLNVFAIKSLGLSPAPVDYLPHVDYSARIQTIHSELTP